MKPDTESSLTRPAPGSAKSSYPSGLLKTLVGLQVFIALCGLLAAGERWASSSGIIAMALAVMLFSRERVHDERVEQLKLKAISYGLVTGLFTASLLNTSRELLKISFLHLPLSAFEVLILILVIALMLFHYWRWQDGRMDKP